MPEPLIPTVTECLKSFDARLARNERILRFIDNPSIPLMAAPS
jgi:hypothetical protein